MKKFAAILVIVIGITQGWSQWVNRAVAPTARWGAGACSLGGYIYMIGGNNGADLATNQRFDPSTNTWTTLAPMPTARSYPAVVGASNGKIYVFGGSVVSTWLNVVEEYDPVTNTWTTKTPMPTNRMGLGAAEYNGKIYVIGGWNGALLATNEEYDFTTNTWLARAAMPTARYMVGCAQSGGQIYAVGGYVAAPVNNNQSYNPVTNTWTVRANLNNARYLHGVTSLGGMVWAIGGFPNTGSTEYYNPASNTWTNGLPLLQARYRVAAAATSTCIYALGGFTGSVTVGTNEENCNVPLPIQLVSFKGKYDALIRKNLLEWTTASEINNAYFRCERSEDAIHWETISTIEGAGNSNIELTYTYEDMVPVHSSYYRLVQVDFDGTENFYGPVFIELPEADIIEYNLYPNPSNGRFTIRMKTSHQVNIRFSDMLGKLEKHISFEGDQFEVDLSDMPNGIYSAVIYIDDQAYYSRIKIQHE